MTTEETIRQYSDVAIGQSVTPVASSLTKRTVFVATPEPPVTQGIATVDRLRFRTGKDNEGRTWAYAYTSEAEFSKAFEEDTGFVELSFVDFFNLIDQDSEFAGIYLNGGSDAAYPIPRELFGIVREVVGPGGG